MQAPQTDTQIGRFRVLRLLGEGAQGQVFLAEDPHLGRSVAIKTLTVADDGVATARRLVDEARTVSQLNHRNIVTLYDAGEHKGLPYLVLEYVPGVTLEALLQRERAIPVSRGVEIALQMLDGLACAHDEGVLHRDIKPANVMIDESGAARLMDFGVAVHQAADSGHAPLVGSPRYLAPECLAYGRFSAQSDVYAVAATLYESVAGRPAVEADDIAAIHEAQCGRILPPSAHNPEVDEQLDGIILRGLSGAPDDRYAGAREMAAALRAYGQRPAETSVSRSGDHDAVNFLLRRMQHKKDFPALSESMRAINRIVASSDESARSLSATILKDFALTNKLLIAVNSAVYGQSGKVSTVSRAVVILGFETVRSIAVTLLFLDHMQNKAQLRNLQEEVIGALLAGLMARELTGDANPQLRETAFLFGIYQSLGRLLAYYYFYDEAMEISRLSRQEGMDEGGAALQVLGVTYERLATEIAKTWNFPQDMLQSMRKLPADRVPERPRNEKEKLWLTAQLAEDLRQATLHGSPDEQQKIRSKLLKRYKAALPITADRLQQVASSASKAVRDEASAMNIDTDQSRVLGRLRLLQEQGGNEPATASDIPDSADMARTMKIQEQQTRTPGSDPAETAADAQTVLTAGIQDITATLVGDFNLNELLQMVIETMYRGMGFTRVLLAVVNEKTRLVEGRLGLGDNIDVALRRFAVPLNEPGDLFAAALQHGKDILVTDAGADTVKNRLPAWFSEAFRPAGFILFPMIVDGRPFGLFYSEQEQAGRLELGKTEADLLITLRNQAVLAIRQSSSRR